LEGVFLGEDIEEKKKANALEIEKKLQAKRKVSRLMFARRRLLPKQFQYLIRIQLCLKILLQVQRP
jgi:hypothetical protein